MIKPQSTDLLADTTVGSALAWARQELALAIAESPSLTAELLIGQVLGWDRARLLTHPEAPVTASARDALAAAVGRRCAGEPLEYIMGEQQFFGLSFRVTPAVLIPRPETEILVEKALDLARESGANRLQFADVGTGSGCIAVSVARELPSAKVWAVDISPAALAVARGNATRHRVSTRVHFICGDMLECFPQRPCFDFILSNPPYVAGPEVPGLPPAVREYEPRLALFGGESGLEACERLVAQASRYLVPGGHFLMEIGAGQSDRVTRMLEGASLPVEGILEDLRGIPRCVVARKNLEGGDG